MAVHFVANMGSTTYSTAAGHPGSLETPNALHALFGFIEECQDDGAKVAGTVFNELLSHEKVSFNMEVTTKNEIQKITTSFPAGIACLYSHDSSNPTPDQATRARIDCNLAISRARSSAEIPLVFVAGCPGGNNVVEGCGCGRAEQVAKEILKREEVCARQGWSASVSWNLSFLKRFGHGLGILEEVERGSVRIKRGHVNLVLRYQVQAGEVAFKTEQEDVVTSAKQHSPQMGDGDSMDLDGVDSWSTHAQPKVTPAHASTAPGAPYVTQSAASSYDRVLEELPIDWTAEGLPEDPSVMMTVEEGTECKWQAQTLEDILSRVHGGPLAEFAYMLRLLRAPTPPIKIAAWGIDEWTSAMPLPDISPDTAHYSEIMGYLEDMIRAKTNFQRALSEHLCQLVIELEEEKAVVSRLLKAVLWNGPVLSANRQRLLTAKYLVEKQADISQVKDFTWTHRAITAGLQHTFA